MKAARIALTALALLAIVGQSAICQQVWQEQRITGDGAVPTAPLIWGQTVYWTDGRSYDRGVFEVRAWDSVHGERVVRETGSDTVLEAVYEDKMVFRRYNAITSTDLYLWDAVNGERPITTAPRRQQNPVIHGSTVVWEDQRSGRSQIYVWDPVNGERGISLTGSEQTNPRIWGDTVVWEDDRNSTQYTYRKDVYMWNPRDGERRLSTYIHGMLSPAIYEDRVLMWLLDDPANIFPEDAGLWEWTPNQGLRQVSAIRKSSRPYYFDTFGEVAVWSASGLGNVGAWDPVHGFTRVNQSAVASAGMPSVYGNKIAWVGNNNVYVSTLVPEPSSLLALGGGLAAVGLPWLRRRVRAKA